MLPFSALAAVFAYVRWSATPAPLQFDSAPFGEDETKRPRSPMGSGIRLGPFPPGEYQVDVRVPGYRDDGFQVRIESGQTTELHPTLVAR